MKSIMAMIALSFAPLWVWNAAPAQALAQTPPAASEVTGSTPEGFWNTVDANTNKPQSVVFIWQEGGTMYGKVVKLFREPNEDPNPVCDDCTGDLHNQPVLGMRILWDLSLHGSEWSGGHIVDPDNGKTYNCKIEAIDGGKRLKVRGYIGFALIGRTEYWGRAEKPQ